MQPMIVRKKLNQSKWNAGFALYIAGAITPPITEGMTEAVNANGRVATQYVFKDAMCGRLNVTLLQKYTEFGTFPNATLLCFC
jgi:hypothetical protein